MARAIREHISDDIEENRVPPDVYDLSRFNLPEDYIKKNREFVYGWVAFRSNQYECRDTYIDECRRGWVAVPRQEYEEAYLMNYRSPFGAKDDTDDLVSRGGQILMKRRRQDYEREMQYYNARAAKSSDDVRRTVNLKGADAEEFDAYYRRFAQPTMFARAA